MTTQAAASREVSRTQASWSLSRVGAEGGEQGASLGLFALDGGVEGGGGVEHARAGGGGLVGLDLAEAGVDVGAQAGRFALVVGLVVEGAAVVVSSAQGGVGGGVGVGVVAGRAGGRFSGGGAGEVGEGERREGAGAPSRGGRFAASAQGEAWSSARGGGASGVR
jgi:hypothetical protein